MRGVRRIIENPIPHGRFDLARAARIAGALRLEHYTRAFVLPLSWKSALIPYLARIPRRVGYSGEARYLLLNDTRARPQGAAATGRPLLCARRAARLARADAPRPGARARHRESRRGGPGAAPEGRQAGRDPVPGRRVRAGEALAAERISPISPAGLIEANVRVWIVGSPNDRLATDALVDAAAKPARGCATSPARPTSAPRST